MKQLRWKDLKLQQGGIYDIVKKIYILQLTNYVLILIFLDSCEGYISDNISDTLRKIKMADVFWNANLKHQKETKITISQFLHQ